MFVYNTAHVSPHVTHNVWTLVRGLSIYCEDLGERLRLTLADLDKSKYMLVLSSRKLGDNTFTMKKGRRK